MTTRLIQLGPEQHESGTAAFQVHGPAAAAATDFDSLEIAIIQPGPIERFLDPRNPDDPWTTSVFHFRPRVRRREGTALWLEINHGVTYHLRANQPYRLRIRLCEQPEFDEVFTGPASMRRPSLPPTGWTPLPDPRGPLIAPVAHIAPPPAPEPPPVPPPEPAPAPPPPIEPPPPLASPEPATMPAPAVVADVLPVATAKARTGRKWILPLVLVLIASGALAAWLLKPTAASDGAIANMDQCRRVVRGNPEPASARDQADALAKGDRLPDCQLLLLLYSGGKGDVPSARQLGIFYDPDTWSKEKSPLPAPNPEQAARWHKLAADAGDVESEYRYGMLLKLGRTDVPDAPEQAQVYLRKAADAGNALAKEALK